MKQRNRLLTEDILRQKIKHRLDLQLKNLLRSGANLERLIKALREAGFSEEKSEKVARLYHSSEFSKPNPEKTRNRKKRLQRSSQPNTIEIKSSIQSLMETGGSYDQALSLAIRSGLERQRAIRIVNESLGRKVKSPWVSIVSGGSVTPK